jgi:hypothetical protein
MKLRSDLEQIGYKCDPNVPNTVINDKQHAVAWHVNVANKNPKVN